MEFAPPAERIEIQEVKLLEKRQAEDREEFFDGEELLPFGNTVKKQAMAAMTTMMRKTAAAILTWRLGRVSATTPTFP